jgi:hypothetical protein
MAGPAPISTQIPEETRRLFEEARNRAAAEKKRLKDLEDAKLESQIPESPTLPYTPPEEDPLLEDRKNLRIALAKKVRSLAADSDLYDEQGLRENANSLVEEGKNLGVSRDQLRDLYKQYKRKGWDSSDEVAEIYAEATDDKNLLENRRLLAEALKQSKEENPTLSKSEIKYSVLDNPNWADWEKKTGLTPPELSGYLSRLFGYGEQRLKRGVNRPRPKISYTSAIPEGTFRLLENSAKMQREPMGSVSIGAKGGLSRKPSESSSYDW